MSEKTGGKAFGGSVPKLQRPKYAWFGGRLVPWDDAVLHVGSEAVVRGLNVFEGVKGYWQPDGVFALLELRRHFDRLNRSARLLHIPVPVSWEEYRDSHLSLVDALLTPEQDMWVRSTLFVIEGHWGAGTKADCVLTAYNQPIADPSPITVGVSSWQRAPDLALPARIKTSTNYQVGRMARIEGRELGHGEMLLMNPSGRLAEGTGCCVLVARDGRVFTPPSWEGALESITVDLVELICADMGVPFERRPVERTELIVADEIAVAGTLAEVTQVTAFDGLELPRTGRILERIGRRYMDAVRGRDPLAGVDLLPVPRSGGAA